MKQIWGNDIYLLHIFHSVQLPLDLSTLSEAERKSRLEARKPRKKVKIMDEVEDNFNARKYMKYIKNKK